jgi:pimeloyl-[acyl-carrier protein] methyl ester esterase
MKILALHGFGFHQRIFDGLKSALGPRFSFQAVDLTGFGTRSSEELKPLLTDLARPAEALLDDEPTVLIGWSLGGLAANHLAAQHPDQVRAVIHLASTPCFVARPAWPGMPAKTLNNFQQRLLRRYAKTIVQFAALQCEGLPQAKEALAELLPFLESSPAPHPNTLTHGLTLLADTDQRELVQTLAQPQYYLLGKRDALIPAAIAPLLTALSPRVDVTLLPGAAHLPFISHCQETVQLISRCLHDL